MDNLEIKKQDFSKAILELKDFAKRIPTKPDLKRFEEGIFWGLVDKNVTGKEMNEFTSSIQKFFIKSNKTSTDIIKEFSKIYEAFNVLDEQYIKYFIVSIEKAEKAGNDALEAQQDIKRTISVLRTTIEKLSEHKKYSSEKLRDFNAQIEGFQNEISTKLEQLHRIERINDGLKNSQHIGDIDNLWEDVQRNKSILESLESVTQIAGQKIDLLVNFKDNLKKQTHLLEIDQLWEDTEKHGNNITKLIHTADRLDSELKVLNLYKKHLESYAHLNDVDEIWKDVQENKSKIHDLDSILQDSNQNIELLHEFKNVLEKQSYLHEIDKIWEDSQKHNNKLDDLNLLTMRIESELEIITQYKKKLEGYSYLAEIDTVWTDVQSQKLDVIELYKQQVVLDKKNNDLENKVCKNFENLRENITEYHNKMNKKIMISYVMNGIAILSLIILSFLYFSK
ncbi:MAG: hypothetical protein Q4G16_04415 [Cruoricaptor ignavus]|nr:hypothetical protein [Cruoricaptor ignavus]